MYITNEQKYAELSSLYLNKKSESEGFERVSIEVLSGVYGKCSLMKGCHKIHIDDLANNSETTELEDFLVKYSEIFPATKSFNKRLT